MSKHHKYTKVFPMMSRKKLPELVDDIKARGLVTSILRDENDEILDGRCRELACELAGVEPRYELFEGTDEQKLQIILSNNLFRRHLTKSQLSMVAARSKRFHEQLAKARQSAAGGRKKDRKALPENFPEAQKGDSRDMAGAGLPISGRLISHADNVIDKGIPEIEEAVDAGTLAVTAAAIVAQLPPAEQTRIFESGGAPAVRRAASVVRHSKNRGRMIAVEQSAPAPPVPDQGRPPASPEEAPLDESLSSFLKRVKAAPPGIRKNVINVLVNTLTDPADLREVQGMCEKRLQLPENQQRTAKRHKR